MPNSRSVINYKIPWIGKDMTYAGRACDKGLSRRAHTYPGCQVTICRYEGLILEIAFGFVTCLNGFNGIMKLIPNLIVFLKNLIEPFFSNGKI